MSGNGKRPSVLITGASSGIGATTAQHLAARGDHVLGTSRSKRPADPDDPIGWLVMDVCEDASVTAAVAEAIERSGGLDAVVLCAGYGIFGSIEDVGIEDAQAQFETNYFGVLRVMRAVLPHMRERGRGRILVVGSLGGRAPIPFQSHYSASKAALDATVMAARIELKEHGVDVSLIEPGDINTPFNDAMDWRTSPSGSAYAAQLDDCEQVIRETLPKAPPPEVVAKAIARALDAAKPRVRYVVGREALLVPFGRRFLPDAWMLRMIARHFRL